MKKQQLGFTVVELVIVLVSVAAIASVGYYVWQHHQSTTTRLSYKSPTVATPVAPPINSSADLKNALQALNQTSVSSSKTDSSQLSSHAAGF